MTPRRDLSNEAIAIETGDRGVRCIARPRRQWVALVIGLIVVGFSATLPRMAERSFQRVAMGKAEPDDLIAVCVAIAPTVAGVAVLASVLYRIRRRRSVEIIDGTVTLHTPDSTTGRHVFDLNNLKGATLVDTAGGATLTIERRRGGRAVPVFLNYEPALLAAAVDVINSQVVDNQFHAFEVIPVAQPQNPTDGPGTAPGKS